MPPTLTLISYEAEQFSENELPDLSGVAAALSEPGVHWLHVQGEVDEGFLRQVGGIFHLHLLALEDVINGVERPKAEEYDEQDFVVMHTVITDGHHLLFDQFSLFVGRNYVLSFHTGRDTVAEAVRARIRAGRGIIRHQGVDYLMYALLDTITDSYFPVLEDIGEHLDYVQEQALLYENPRTMRLIQASKRELLHLRRVIWPVRELLTALMRDDNDNVSEHVRHYLRDCYDHIIQLMDMLEVYREMASDLMDGYLSALSNRMNAVMKVLTIIATIFMPLTFLAGIYGMNFDPDASPWNMPELRWYWGYPATLLAMALTTILMLVYFWRRGWVGRPDLPCPEEERPRSQQRRERVDLQ